MRRLVRIMVRGSGNGRARGILRIWPWWEAMAHKLWPVKPAPRSPHGLVGVHFRRYKGKCLVLADGTRIGPGDWLGELHFDNQACIRVLTTDGQAITGSGKWAIAGIFREELRAVALWIESGQMPRPIVAIVGITVLGRGAVRIGFEMRPREGRILPLVDKLFVDGLLIIYTPEGADRMLTGMTAGDRSMEAWMSEKALLSRYGPDQRPI